MKKKIKDLPLGQLKKICRWNPVSGCFDCRFQKQSKHCCLNLVWFIEKEILESEVEVPKEELE